MAVRFGKHRNRLQGAYTLAEVLIVMTIIMLIMLALPPMTKKVFKIGETHKPHGRFECYWKTNDKGEKELHSFISTEGGDETDRNLGKNAEYCEFKPSINSIYYVIHAVGGGGAGALIGDVQLSDGTVINVGDLEDKQLKVQTTSNLSAANPNAWTSWVTWMTNNYSTSTLPWADSSTTTGLKKLFDVETVDTKQLMRYRVSGSVGKVVSTFLPELPQNVTIRMKPGKGGELSVNDFGTGKDGTDTTIEYVYEGKAPILALKARGGAGGNGSVDSKITYSLVGGPATDFDLSIKSSIKEKTSGFKDVVDDIEGLNVSASKVPATAGDSGRGETQFVKDTAGELLYENNYNTGTTNGVRRVATDWKTISDKIKNTYYKRPYFTTNPKCSLVDYGSSTDYLEVSREGYCDFDTDYTTSSLQVYRCAIGKVPKIVLDDITKAEHAFCPSYRSSYKCSNYYGRSYSVPGEGSVYYSDSTTDYRLYTVTYNTYNGTYTVINNNIKPYYMTEYGSRNNSKYYGCTFDNVFTCKDRVANPKVWRCTTESSKNMCSNGVAAKTRDKDSNKYKSLSSNDKEAKCPASGGGDGAAVILW